MSSDIPRPPHGGTSRRSELKRAYREQGPAAGIFAIRNLTSGKVAVGSAMNVQGALNRFRFELTQRMHRTWPGLQEDWDRLGADSFCFEVLDVLPPPEDPAVDRKEELKVLEALWLERLRPDGEAGYNVAPV
jgi:hypothetical protein